jgi:hypothetical protein
LIAERPCFAARIRSSSARPIFHRLRDQSSFVWKRAAIGCRGEGIRQQDVGSKGQREGAQEIEMSVIARVARRYERRARCRELRLGACDIEADTGSSLKLGLCNA